MEKDDIALIMDENIKKPTGIRLALSKKASIYRQLSKSQLGTSDLIDFSERKRLYGDESNDEEIQANEEDMIDIIDEFGRTRRVSKYSDDGIRFQEENSRRLKPRLNEPPIDFTVGIGIARESQVKSQWDYHHHSSVNQRK